MESRALRPSRFRSERARRWLSIVVVCAALAVWRCPWAELLGVPCPGCGLTRAALALAVGDLMGAVDMHPLSPALIPFGVWLGWRELARGASRCGPVRSAAPGGSEGFAAVLAVAFVSLCLVVWIARFFGAFGGPVPVSSHLHG